MAQATLKKMAHNIGKPFSGLFISCNISRICYQPLCIMFIGRCKSFFFREVKLFLETSGNLGTPNFWEQPITWNPSYLKTSQTWGPSVPKDPSYLWTSNT